MQVERIVSLVPSLSELVCGVGLGQKLVGCTKFCTHPHFLQDTRKVVGGTKNVHLDRILALEPDLILAAKEENSKEQVDLLRKHFYTYVANIKKLSDMKEVLALLAAAGGDQLVVKQLTELISEPHYKTERPIKALYLIWSDPYMSVGGDTYISSMLELGGFSNALSGSKRYPEVTIDNIKKLAPEVILLSSEPFPFKEKHRRLMEEQIQIPCKLVNGEWFSWYDSRVESHLDNIKNLAATI